MNLTPLMVILVSIVVSTGGSVSWVPETNQISKAATAQLLGAEGQVSSWVGAFGAVA